MDKIREEIKKYCDINGEDVELFTNKILRIGFNITKYGSKPTFMEKNVVKPVIEEKVIEVEPIVKKDTFKKDIYGE